MRTKLKKNITYTNKQIYYHNSVKIKTILLIINGHEKNDDV